jgi:serine/threonine-protein kinase
VLGKGGMGVVHRATDLSLARPVAVKLLHETADDDARERLLAEARRTASLRHPAIVEVFDVGREGDEVFVVMELCEGEPLSARLKREKRLAPADAVGIAAAICDALAVAHDAGVVHRDLKPANVFLAKGDPERVKLLDFGIAKRIEGGTERTAPGAFLGTLEYTAPEQIRGDALDGRADLYALGLVLYRIVTGANAMAADDVATLVHRQLAELPPPPATKASIPDALDAAIMRLLRKEPDARFPDARAAKRALLEAIDARPPARSADAPPSVPASVPAREAPPRELPAIGPAPGGKPPWLPEVGPPPSAGRAAKVELAADDRPPVTFEVAPAPRPLVPPPSRPAPLSRAPLPPPPPASESPAWLALLEGVPRSFSKRLVAYALVALLIYDRFFGGGAVLSAVLLVAVAFGAAAYWARLRADGGRPDD